MTHACTYLQVDMVATHRGTHLFLTLFGCNLTKNMRQEAPRISIDSPSCLQALATRLDFCALRTFLEHRILQRIASQQQYIYQREYTTHIVVLQTSLSGFDVSMWLQHQYHSCVVIGHKAGALLADSVYSFVAIVLQFKYRLIIFMLYYSHSIFLY